MSTIRREDFEAQLGRADGGDFMHIVHKPSGISRRKGPPLGPPGKAREEMLREINVDLLARGWSPPAKDEKEA
ncbi:MAG: hypothetical protein V4773_19800 [Verrucomicrobiota bacterium]